MVEILFMVNLDSVIGLQTVNLEQSGFGNLGPILREVIDTRGQNPETFWNILYQPQNLPPPTAQVIPPSGLLANSHVSATDQTELNYSLRRTEEEPESRKSGKSPR